MPGLFITATGTDVGKTYVTAALIRAGRRAGVAMDALKPILTGYSEAHAVESDAGRLLDALGRPLNAATIAEIAPWRFAAPLSPNMAAAAEGHALELGSVAAACRARLRPDRLTLIEGIGGVMVPLNGSCTVLDLIAVLGLPVVLVTGTHLGALSHCLTAAAVLRARQHTPVLVLVDESADSTVPIEATQQTLAAFSPDVPVLTVPRNASDATFDALLPRLHTPI